MVSGNKQEPTVVLGDLGASFVYPQNVSGWCDTALTLRFVAPPRSPTLRERLSGRSLLKIVSHRCHVYCVGRLARSRSGHSQIELLEVRAYGILLAELVERYGCQSAPSSCLLKLLRDVDGDT